MSGESGAYVAVEKGTGLWHVLRRAVPGFRMDTHTMSPAEALAWTPHVAALGLHFAFQQDDCCSPERYLPSCDYVERCHECGQDWPCRTHRVAFEGSAEGPSWDHECGHCAPSEPTP